MSVKATELRKGTVIEKDGDLLLITDYSHSTPGNWRAIIQIKTKSLKTGQTGAMRPSAGDMFEVAFLEKRRCEYLYREANGHFVFMDAETYEQFPLGADLVGDKMGYVKENTAVDVTFHEKLALGIELPPQVVLEVTEAEPVARGNTANTVKKEVVVETGMTVKVPGHIDVGDRIKVRTDDGEFQGRA
jgi:elongation factor P